MYCSFVLPNILYKFYSFENILNSSKPLCYNLSLKFFTRNIYINLCFNLKYSDKYYQFSSYGTANMTMP